MEHFLPPPLHTLYWFVTLNPFCSKFLISFRHLHNFKGFHDFTQLPTKKSFCWNDKRPNTPKIRLFWTIFWAMISNTFNKQHEVVRSTTTFTLLKYFQGCCEAQHSLQSSVKDGPPSECYREKRTHVHNTDSFWKRKPATSVRMRASKTVEQP